MYRFEIYLALAAALTAACAPLPPNPNSVDSGERMDERHFIGCEPETDVPPKLLGGRAPIYPPVRYLYGQDGYAIVEFDVTSEGKVVNLTNTESSHPAFYGHTYVAVKEWLFKPASQEGVPVTVHCGFRQGFKTGKKR